MEFDLIARIRARCSGARGDVVLGIGDDAALLQVPESQQLVVTMDTLVAGRHFPEQTAPADIGWKALAVNLSDLAAMAATPAWCTLALTLPDADAEWLDGFLDGYCALATQHNVALVGGDTTRGPLSITVTAFGLVPAGQALRRDGAQVGDDIWVTGTLGDAAAALAQWREGSAGNTRLRARLDRPTPRLSAGLALRGLAHAGIDISDGLLADLGHVLAASGLGASVELARLPTSPALAEAFTAAQRWSWQLTGGDDYELCFAAAPESAGEVAQRLAAIGVPACMVGRVHAAPGLTVLAPDGSIWTGVGPSGFDHFARGVA